MSGQAKQLNFDLETELIIECSQTAINSAKFDRIAYLLSQSPDWNYIFKIANRNAILPLVSWNLLQNFEHLIPDEFRELIHKDFQEHTRNNMFLTGKLVEIINLFQSNDIAIVPFKGPILAIRAYGNLALRQFIDLDILIPILHLEKAVKLLTEAGYIPLNLQRLDNLKRKKDVGFISEDERVRVEMHWKLSGRHFSMPLEMNQLWHQLETVKLAGMDVSAFSFNTLLIYLCLHGARHSWERFGWICDINELVRAESDVDWRQVFNEAKRLGCESVLGLGLYLAYDFFGLKISTPKWQEIEDDQIIKELARQIRSRIFADKPATLEIGDRYLYHLKLKEKWTDKWKLHLHYNYWYLKIIFSPNEIDKGLFHLPSWLSPLYYVLRPPRLLYSYLLKPKTRVAKN